MQISSKAVKETEVETKIARAVKLGSCFIHSSEHLLMEARVFVKAICHLLLRLESPQMFLMNTEIEKIFNILLFVNILSNRIYSLPNLLHRTCENSSRLV